MRRLELIEGEPAQTIELSDGEAEALAAVGSVLWLGS